MLLFVIVGVDSVNGVESIVVVVEVVAFLQAPRTSSANAKRALNAAWPQFHSWFDDETPPEVAIVSIGWVDATATIKARTKIIFAILRLIFCDVLYSSWVVVIVSGLLALLWERSNRKDSTDAVAFSYGYFMLRSCTSPSRVFPRLAFFPNFDRTQFKMSHSRHSEEKERKSFKKTWWDIFL